MQPLHIKKDQLCVKKDTSASSTSISARRSERIFFDDPRSGPCALLLYITARLGLPAGFFYSWNQTFMCQFTEFYTGHPEFTHVSARASID